MNTAWPQARLGDVATLQRGFDLPVKSRLPGHVPVFAANGPVGSHSEEKLSGPGVVTGRSGTIGKVHFVDGPFWPLNTSLFVKDFHGNEPKYVYWLLRRLRLERFHSGTGVPTLNRNIVHEVPVPLPPIEEQRRIAAVLDAADALRAKRRQALAKLDTLTQAIFIDMFGDPVRNERAWPVSSLDDASLGIFDCPHSTPKWTDEGVVCLRTSNLGRGVWDWADTRYVSEETFEERSKRGYLEPQDIVLSREGTVGIAALVEDGMRLCMGQRLVQVRPDPAAMRPQFLLDALLFLLAPERIARVMAGSTAKHLNVKELRALGVIAPPITAQAEYERAIEVCIQKRACMQQGEAQLDTLFASLQQRAFRGEL